MNSSALFSRKNIVGNAVSLTAGSALAQGLMALAVLIVARQLGAAAFGQYAAGFSATALLSVGFNLGLDTWLLRAGAARRGQLGGLLRAALTIKLAAGIPWVIGVAVLLPVLNGDSFRSPVVWVAALTLWLEGLFSLGLAVFRTLLRNETTARLLIASRSSIFILTVALTFSGERAVLPYALVRLVVGAALALIVWRLMPVKLTGETTWTSLAASRASLPFALSDLFASVYVQADVTIAAILLGKEAVGLYAPASSIISALFVVPTALYQVAIPILTAALGDATAQRRRLTFGTLVIFAAIGLALWFGVRLTAGLLPRILGASFEGSSTLLTILSPILLMKGATFGAAAILVAAGWQTRRTVVQAAAALLNVALNLTIVARLGITGVAGVYVISEVLLAVGYLALVGRWWRATTRAEAARHPT